MAQEFGMNWETLASIGGVAGPIVMLMLYLHKRRGDLTKEIRQDMTALRDSAEAAHRDLSVKFSDMALTVAQHYVRKDEMTQSMHGLTDQIIDARKEIGGINNRIDTLIEKVEWRRQPR